MKNSVRTYWLILSILLIQAIGGAAQSNQCSDFFVKDSLKDMEADWYRKKSLYYYKNLSIQREDAYFSSVRQEALQAILDIPIHRTAISEALEVLGPQVSREMPYSEILLLKQDVWLKWINGILRENSFVTETSEQLRLSQLGYELGVMLTQGDILHQKNVLFKIFDERHQKDLEEEWQKASSHLRHQMLFQLRRRAIEAYRLSKKIQAYMKSPYKDIVGLSDLTNGVLKHLEHVENKYELTPSTTEDFYLDITIYADISP